MAYSTLNKILSTKTKVSCVQHFNPKGILLSNACCKSWCFHEY